MIIQAQVGQLADKRNTKTIIFKQGSAIAEDGTKIYYSELGDGLPPLILSSGIGCDQFIWKYIAPEFVKHHKIVRWNYRGHGKSEVPRDPRKVTMADMVTDLSHVMKASGMPKGVLMGHSMGVQVCLEFHRRYPQMVQGLVLICGSYGKPLDTLHGKATAAELYPVLKKLAKLLPGPLRNIWRKVTGSELSYQVARIMEEINPSLTRYGDFIPYMEHLSEVDPVLFVNMLGSLQGHSAEAHLPAVDVPVLIIAGEKDRWTPRHLSDKMAESIPGAEILVVPGGTHIAPLERPELVNLRIEKFILERIGSHEP